MTYAKLTLKELKSICKDNHLKNYSALNKTELIAFIKKNKKKKQNKKKVGGVDGVLNRETLLKFLGNITEEQLIEETTIKLNEKDIKNIQPDTFKGLKNLQKLNLNYNQIETIESGAFNGLTKLEELYLEYNQITTIKPDIFNGLNILKKLVLKNNQITTINPVETINNNTRGLFSELKILMFLDLSGNKINTIKENTFDGINNLTNLQLILGKSNYDRNNIILNNNSVNYLKSLNITYIQKNKFYNNNN